MKLNLRSVLMLLLTLLLCSVSPALSASLTIVSTGSGNFSVQGNNMDGVGGIDLTIGYETATLSAPRVSWGGVVTGALSIANTASPGVIRIAIIRTEPFTGNGQIAALTFASQGDTGGLTSFTAKLIDSKGIPVATQASIAPGAGPSVTTAAGPNSAPGASGSNQESSRSSTVTSTAQSVQGSAGAGLGTVVMPAEPQVQKEEKPVEKVPAEAASEAAPQQSDTVVAERAPEAADTEQPLTQSAYGSILDRFRGFQGDRTPESMTALFDKPVAPDIQQEPAIVISDGKATARISLDLAVSKGSAANISLVGVTLVNLKNGDEKGRLVIDVQPLGRVSKASVTIFTGRAVLEYPVTVVPPVEGVTGSRTDFAAFLRDSGAKTPKFDLNGDGRHDYQDDYIYTAHYLLAPKAPVKGAK